MPSHISRYEIRKELGRGMMGVVYEVHDPALGRTIALKTIHLAVGSAGDREEYERRFLAEARIAARLSHPGIVVVHDVGRDEDKGILFIALEHLHGR
ncbi:MAG TPA: serine/threonine protein kinase, partial [Vicinamibacteria bacterium]|nr:serine/threonine protein kinase [Vicinamibacteria bacterium]